MNRPISGLYQKKPENCHFDFPLLLMWSLFSDGQRPTAVSPSPLHRQYREGEKLFYHMKGVNDCRVHWQCGSRLRARRRHHGLDVVAPLSAAIGRCAIEVMRVNFSEK